MSFFWSYLRCSCVIHFIWFYALWFYILFISCHFKAISFGFSNHPLSTYHLIILSIYIFYNTYLNLSLNDTLRHLQACFSQTNALLSLQNKSFHLKSKPFLSSKQLWFCLSLFGSPLFHTSDDIVILLPVDDHAKTFAESVPSSQTPTMKIS